MIEICLRYMIINESLKYLGYEAKVPNHEYDCFDCEQLINVVYRDLFSFSIRKDGFGKSSTTKVMTSSVGVLTTCQELSKKEKIEFIHNNIKPGDILFFHTQSLKVKGPKENNRYPGHLALYLGNMKFIHARSTAGKVIIEDFKQEYFLEILVGYKNMIPTILEMYFEPSYQKRK